MFNSWGSQCHLSYVWIEAGMGRHHSNRDKEITRMARLNKQEFQSKKNNEARSTLKKILLGLFTRKANVRRFSVWPTARGVNINMEVDYETETSTKEDT